MKSTPKDIGLRIRIARESLDANQKEFATLIGVSNKVVSSYENGDTTPSLDVLVRIAYATGKTFDWLIAGFDMPNGDRKQISEQEILLLELFRLISDEDREMVLKITKMAAAMKPRKSKPKG